MHELSASPLLVEGSTVDLAVHVLPDGVRAGDLIGVEQQYFPGLATFSGCVFVIHAGEVLFERQFIRMSAKLFRIVCCNSCL